MYRAVVVPVLLLFALGACSPVQFHEKELLNDRMMVFDHDAANAEMRQHMITPREGSLGGFATVGAGGCSCK